ncbi:MAG: pullulanase-type alpha-1,6-glucosidase [Anaerolineales bacterium]
MKLPLRSSVIAFGLAALLLALFFFPVFASGETVRGELNSWGSSAMTANLGGTFLLSTQDTTPDDSLHEFKFFKDTNLWYGNGSSITFATIFSGINTSGGNMSFNHTQNRYYAFKWNGNDKGVVFQFDGAPASITTVNRTPSAPGNSDIVTIDITLNAAFPSGQAAFLRYTTDNWSTSTVVKMTGSGTAYSATIPAQADGTTVRYYVFTSGDVVSIAPADADLMTVTYDTNGGSNYSYSIGNPISDAQALWLDTNTLAWNGTTSGVTQYRLLYDPDGAVDTAYGASPSCTFPAPAAPCYVALTPSGTISGYTKNPNATGLTRLTTGLSDTNAKYLLKGQVVVAAYNGSNALVDVSRTQIQSVLDALYASNAKTQTLGVTYSGAIPTLRVWAPTAKTVQIRKYEDSTTGTYTTHALTEDPASGVWSVTGDATWNRDFFLLDVEVYVPKADALLHNLVTDPYAVSLSTNSLRSQFVNLNDSDLKPSGWDTLTKPTLNNFEDITIYEMHIRDFSINDSTVGASERGTYMAFTYDGAGPDPNTTLSDGMAHLLALKDAGLTHVHLLPTFDIASVPEASVARSVSPNPTGYARDSNQPQSIVGATRTTDGFNWGYDPFHYGVPEGSYSTNPDGVTRILEFRHMVSALNQNGLRVVMDMVYNHTAASGQNDKSVLDKVVPGYYYRYTTDGALYTDSCCDDTATEYEMMEKLMIDTVKRFAVDYKIDGFRFDLMNFHTRQNMLNLKNTLNALTIASDGVDGTKIYLYGEGWDFGSAKHKGLTTCPNCYAQKYNMTGSGIGAFNDILRDAAHGGYSTDTTEIRAQGFINGLSYDWNGYFYTNRFQSDLWNATDKLRSALRGSGTDWNGQGAPFTDDPQESVPYVEKHDNETLFDQNIFKLPSATNITNRVRSQNMGQSLVLLSQGVPFVQMGSDILRSKSLDRNSYDSGDWFNRIDWTYTTNYFGSGLPPAWDNSSRWSIMSPLLVNTAFDPAQADIEFAAAHFREMLRIRYSSPLFRLTSESDINSHVTHYTTNGTNDGLIVMKLTDGAALDPNWETILVFFNANKIQQNYTISGANGFTLHPIHTDGVDDDPVITGGAAFNDSTDQFSIPARTTAVFVSNQPITDPSTLDWVGRLWPRGGVANDINEGGFVPSGFDVYVRVYEAGVTPTAGAPSGIECTLHWGKYGTAWADIPMTWNAQQGNDDEFKGTIPQATLNALTPGTYGFTAYCKKTGESGIYWKADTYDIDGVAADDDQGDGLITIIPTADSSPQTSGGVLVHLFEWKWSDIQKECAYLGQKGYTAVQVSPPQEHLVPIENQGGGAGNDYPWWARYQPVTFDTTKFTSRSGTWTEFTAMVNACNAAGVDVIVDAVINHMAADPVSGTGTGTAGTTYQYLPASSRFYGSQFTSADFHTDCEISSYADRAQVQSCKLSGLPDLNTGRAATQTKLTAYLQALLNAGVKGFRIDGAKHIAAQEIAAILNGLTLPGGGKPYIFQEVIDQSTNERVRDWEYTPNGDVTEFAYPYFLGHKFDSDGCSGTLSQLQNLETGMLPSRFALVFTDNHDNQRGHGVGPGSCILDHRDGQEHLLANIFVLAYPYGYPSIMSSYYWQSDPTINTNDSYGPPTVNGGPGSSGETLSVHTNGDSIPDNCASTYTWGKWACEHRRTAIANMVYFRKITAGESLSNWQNIGGSPSDHIAFGLGAKGFVAINQSGSAAPQTYTTSLPDGDYCDITKYDFIQSTAQCVLPGTITPTSDKITVSGGQISNYTLANNDAFAIHIGARLNTDYGNLSLTYGLAWHSDNGNGLKLGTLWQTDDGIQINIPGPNWQPNIPVTVIANVNGGSDGNRWLTCWFDWNQDGDFTDSNEKNINQSVNSGNNNITFNIPNDADIGSGTNTVLPIRCRLYESGSEPAAFPRPPISIMASNPSGGATGGEVEDYEWQFGPNAVELLTFAASTTQNSPAPLWIFAGIAAFALILGGAAIRKQRA